MRPALNMPPSSEIVGIIRALGYLATEARTSGMPDVAEYIITALHNSGDWALQKLSDDLKAADRDDRLAVIELVSRFMSSSEAAREAFLDRAGDDVATTPLVKMASC